MLAPAPQKRVATAATEAGRQWLDALLRGSSEPVGALEPALAPSRAAAREQLAAFLAAGSALPQRRQEDWRLTDPSALLRVPPHLAAPASPSPRPGAKADAVAGLRLQLDGQRDPLEGVSLPAGLERLDPAALAQHRGQALATNRSMEFWPVLLNQALASQVLALRVRGAEPLRLELVSNAGPQAGVLPLRILLVLDPGARLELLERHRGAEGTLTSVLLEAELADGAELSHGLVGEGHQGCLLVHQAVVQQPGSVLQLVEATSGWDLVRIEPRVVQSAGAARTVLRALQWVQGRELADTHSEVRFEGPDGELDQLHKAVADEAGHSVFHGAVVVPRLAQRTAAAQISRGLLLSSRARIDARPQLEIVADDVRCTHGATVSTLQPEQLFYLRSRGIAAPRAARLLLRGFCEEVLSQLPLGCGEWHPSGWIPRQDADAAQQEDRR